MEASSSRPQLIRLGTTHEALGVISGKATLRFGQSDHETQGGMELNVAAGDVLVIPAGVMHRALQDSQDFLMVGAYPAGSQPWDMQYGRSEKECQAVLQRLHSIPIPAEDPWTGGPLWQ